MSSFKEKGLLLDAASAQGVASTHGYDDWCRKCWKEQGPNHKASSTVEESEASDTDNEGSSSTTTTTKVWKDSEVDEQDYAHQRSGDARAICVSLETHHVLADS